MTRIILTRHGETIENQQGILQGQVHGTLSKKGINQAKKLANKLSKEKIDYIFSSDLKRAADTTKEIIKFHKNVPLEFTKELRERHLGELQGRKKSDLGIDKSKLVGDWLKNKEGETSEQMYERAKKFINRIIKEYNGKNLLLIGHNAINKSIILNILDKPIDEIRQIESQKNTAITIIRIENNKPLIEIFNCIKHLE